MPTSSTGIAYDLLVAFNVGTIQVEVAELRYISLLMFMLYVLPEYENIDRLEVPVRDPFGVKSTKPFPKAEAYLPQNVIRDVFVYS